MLIKTFKITIAFFAYNTSWKGTSGVYLRAQAVIRMDARVRC